jgi:hypothetical protein
MRCIVCFVALILGIVAIGRASEPPPSAKIDLTKIARHPLKEPAYKGQPGYLLLALGREAKHTAWLVLDGDTLYVDRRGDGDLTRPDARVLGKTHRYGEHDFEAGDLAVGGQSYTKLLVQVNSAKRMLGVDTPETGFFGEFLSRHPDGKVYLVAVEVPLPKPFPDVRDKSPLTRVDQVAGEHDQHGVLQFAGKPAAAPVIHFGGPWTFWPQGKQRLLRGRGEELMFNLGTPGHGPGTFAGVRYDFLVPATAKPHLTIEYAADPGEKPIKQECAIEDRC